jgi:hypothetical protein
VQTTESAESVHLDGVCVETDPVIKTYLTSSDHVTARVASEGVELSFDEPSEVTLGARSYATGPTGTVSTTADPEGLAWAVSHFGAAVESTAPERSYPTLRGHPPTVDLGDGRIASPGVEMASSDVTVAVEPTVASVLRAAPLAYYLGAPLTLSDDARLTADGETTPLGGPEGPMSGELLRHVFICDVAARQHGEHGFGCRAAAEVQGLLDFEALYDAPHAERMAAYLRAPLDRTLDAAPAWPTVAHVEPRASSVEALPPLVDDLALVRPETPPRYSGPDARQVALETFVEPATARGVTQVVDGGSSFVDLPETDALFDVWVGEGIPLGGLKSLPTPQQEDLHDEQDGIVNVRLVCNDPEMEPEVATAARNYGVSDTLPFDVRVHREVSVDRLRELLGRDASLFHFVGHATQAGLECTDGYLETASVPTVGTETFLLNACQSYSHAISLVERGARGGIVTLADVDNESALWVGKNAARALNIGHSLRTTVELLRRGQSSQNVYSVVGDTMASVAQSGGNAATAHVTRAGDCFEVVETPLPVSQVQVGSLSERLGHDTDLVLIGQRRRWQVPDEEELLSVIRLGDEPLLIDGDLHWSSDLTPEDLR